MMTNIRIAGKERPFVFSNVVAYEYERRTGRTYTADLFLLFDDLERVAKVNADGGDNVSARAAAQIHISRWADFAFAGLAYAHRKAGQPLDFEVDDVAAWLLEDEAAATEVFAIIVQSVTGLTDAKDDDRASKKKK